MLASHSQPVSMLWTLLRGFLFPPELLMSTLQVFLLIPLCHSSEVSCPPYHLCKSRWWCCWHSSAISFSQPLFSLVWAPSLIGLSQSIKHFSHLCWLYFKQPSKNVKGKSSMCTDSSYSIAFMANDFSRHILHTCNQSLINVEIHWRCQHKSWPETMTSTLE